LGFTQRSYGHEKTDPLNHCSGKRIPAKRALRAPARLAQDSCVEDSRGWSGVTLALNVASPEEVRGVTEEARAAGGEVRREPGETFWGGYDSIFIDPEGHPWEAAYNPRWRLTADGGVHLA
jgi:uncharacterized glyoxalase superfamily protein PhnB